MKGDNGDFGEKGNPGLDGEKGAFGITGDDGDVGPMVSLCTSCTHVDVPKKGETHFPVMGVSFTFCAIRMVFPVIFIKLICIGQFTF